MCLELCNEPAQGTDLKKEKNDLANLAHCAVVFVEAWAARRPGQVHVF